MSWGGTMFEYLMPLLLMRSFPGTLLDQSCRASVRRQIEYGREPRRAVGHLRMRLRVHRSRGQLSVPRVRRARARPQARPGRRPRRRAVRDGARRRSSIRRRPPTTSSGSRATGSMAGSGSTRRSTTGRACRTPTRAPRDPAKPADRARLLRAPPGHVARRAGQRRCSNDAFVARFHADPRVQATELLLQERVPREAILSEPRPAESTTPTRRCRRSHRGSSGRRTRRSAHSHFLSNGRYTTLAHQRRRRLQHVARPRGHPAARTTGRSTAARTSSTCAIPWSNRVWSADLSAGRPGARRLRRRRSSWRRSTFRRRDGDFETHAPGRGVAGRRRRDAAAVDHQPRRSAARARGHQLRGDRARPARPTTSRIRRSASCSSRPSSIRRAPACCSAAGRARVGRSADLGVSRPRARGPHRAAPSNGRPIARASSAAADRSANPVALDGRALSGTTGAVLDPVAALRERVHLRAGRVRPHDVCHRRRRRSRDRRSRWSRKYRDGSAAARVLSMAFTHVHIDAAAPGAQRRSGDPVRPPGVARVRRPIARCISPARHRGEHAGQSNLWGYGISGDLPIVLVRITDTDVVAARPPAAARAGVLARQGPARRCRDPERASGRVSRRDAGPADASRAGAALGRLDTDKPGGMFLLRSGRHGQKRIAGCWPRSRASCCAAISASSARSCIGRRRGCIRTATSASTVTLTRAGAGGRARRGAAARHGQRRSAASRRTAANTSSCSTAIAKRRCPGRT